MLSGGNDQLLGSVLRWLQSASISKQALKETGVQLLLTDTQGWPNQLRDEVSQLCESLNAVCPL